MMVVVMMMRAMVMVVRGVLAVVIGSRCATNRVEG